MKISPPVPVAHTLRLAPHQPSRYCCPLHFVTGAFSPDRTRMSLGAPDAPPPSLGDITPKERSRHCTLDNTATKGLYERLPPDRALVFRNARVLTMQGQEALTGQDEIRFLGTTVGTPHPGLDIYSTSDIRLRANIVDLRASFNTWQSGSPEHRPVRRHPLSEFPV